MVRPLLTEDHLVVGIRLWVPGATRKIWVSSMRRLIPTLVTVACLLPIQAQAQDAKQAKSQVDFGIAVAQRGLWKEALYRWQRAVELNPSYAAAWNNLAIAYEHEGNFEEARKAYEKALSLDPKNLFIKQNYELFKEINDRANRRPDR